MTTPRFWSYELRTIDLPSARAFYAEVLGPEIWGESITLVPLPERARAAGAPAHWLGQIGVADVAATAARVLAQGGQQLGPPERSATGAASRVVLREINGAGIALTAEVGAPSARVAWHQLSAPDHVQAFAAYSSWFGWSATDLVDAGGGVGPSQLFAWDDSGRSAGGISSAARLPGVHPHWLFCFAVEDIDAALARARDRGASALPAIRMPRGDRVAACDDPQGAAFGLYQLAQAS